MKVKTEQRAFHVVAAVIREWDPYALLANGCPADEFDSGIARLVGQIPRIKSPLGAAQALSEVFSSSFEKQGLTPEDCRAVATKLFDELSCEGLVE